jgi:tetratricopeptide (TPR) repeat protein
MIPFGRELKSVWPYFIIALLIVLVYLPTFSGEFILDDRVLIEKNPYIKALHSPVSYFIQEDGITDNSNSGDSHTGYYRPLINLTYSIDYHVWGLNAAGFRITNLFLHLCCCFFLFCLLEFFIKNRTAALLATLIFAMHPVNTEAVSWVVARNNIIVTMFSISTVLFYAKGWESGKLSDWLVSVLSFSLAVFCKEVGLMVLPILFLYQRLLSRTRRNIHMELIGYLPFIATVVVYFLLRKSVTTSYISPSEMSGFLTRIYFVPYVILWNLKLILLPHGLHSFVIVYPSTYLNWQAFAGFVYVGLSGVFVWKQRQNKLMVFSLLSFYIALFPTLNIFPHSAISLLSMRWLYFPMVFLLIIFACLIKSILKLSAVTKVSVLCSIFIYLGTYSYLLNSRLWHNEDNFYKQEVLGFQNHYYAGGLAELFYNKAEYHKADAFFQLAIKHFPQRAIHYINYSALLTDTDRPDAALAYLEKSRFLFKTPKTQGEWFNNMGAAYFRLGNYDDSLKNFLAAIEYCPEEIDFRVNLGGAYTAVGDYVKGAFVLEKTLEMAKDLPVLRKNLALNYILLKRYEEAMAIMQPVSKEDWAKYGFQKIFEKARKGLSK